MTGEIPAHRGIQMPRKKRFYGPKIDFKSLSCAPVNELGVVYLFGVLHDVFDFKIEAIQSSFPDCIARRQVSNDKWEELRIEFEYMSRAFVQHKHDPEKADIIVCWKHNWKACPDHIEVIELSSLIPDMEIIAKDVQRPKKLTAWNRFARQKRLEGLPFKEIAKLWRNQKKNKQDRKPVGETKRLSRYNEFCREKRLEGKTFAEIGELWRILKEKENQSAILRMGT